MVWFWNGWYYSYSYGHKLQFQTWAIGNPDPHCVAFSICIQFRYSRYDEQLNKTKAFNREKELDCVAQIDEIVPGKLSKHSSWWYSGDLNSGLVQYLDHGPSRLLALLFRTWTKCQIFRSFFGHIWAILNITNLLYRTPEYQMPRMSGFQMVKVMWSDHSKTGKNSNFLMVLYNLQWGSEIILFKIRTFWRSDLKCSRPFKKPGKMRI